MELLLAHIEQIGEQTFLSAPRTRRADRNVCAPSRFAFVTYAVEIEGEAPLIFISEAVDD